MQVNGTEAAATRQARWLPRVGELLHLDTEAGPVLYRVAKAKPLGVLLRPVPRDEVVAIQAEHRAAQLAFAVEVTGLACAVAASLRAHFAVRGAEVVSQVAEATEGVRRAMATVITQEARRRPGWWRRLVGG